MNIQLPENVKRLTLDEKLAFACHPGVSCFTECCRELELALTPYDVLRLKKELQLSATEFLDRYVVIEKEPGCFPGLYLAMVDDGRASCPFVSRQGCRVYQSRPGACRAYPVGRAAFQTPCGGNQEFHVLVREPHCRGFDESVSRTVAEWLDGQGLSSYNMFNDEVMTVLQNPQLKRGMRLSDPQVDAFLLAFYDLDGFKELAVQPRTVELFALTSREREALAADDEILLRFAVRWLKKEIFGE